MRSDDALMGVVAATLGFGAVAMAAAGAGWLPVAAFAAISAVLLLMVLGRALVTPRVVLVGDPDGPAGGRLGGMTKALEDAGFAVRACPGPTHRPCPVLQGNPCPLLGGGSAVVVFHPATYSGPVPPCGLALALPQLTVEDRSNRDPDVKEGWARVGGDQGPEAAIATLRALLEESSLAGSSTAAPR